LERKELASGFVDAQKKEKNYHFRLPVAGTGKKRNVFPSGCIVGGPFISSSYPVAADHGDPLKRLVIQLVNQFFDGESLTAIPAAQHCGTSGPYQHQRTVTVSTHHGAPFPVRFRQITVCIFF
jgi:hypothetical protein